MTNNRGPKIQHTTQEVVFVCDLNPMEGEIHVVGDFNQWQADTNLMTKAKDLTYTCKLKLAPGTYEYKFLVNGIWYTDHRADRQVMNCYGTLNSVIEVR